MAVTFETKNLGNVCVLTPHGKIVIGDEVANSDERQRLTALLT